MTTDSSEIITGALANQIIQGTSVHMNVAQSAIVITEDKVKLCLIEHLSKTEARRQWVAPAGVLLTLVVTFPTTTFKDFVLKAATWEAIFVIATILTIGWLVRAIASSWKAPTVENIVSVMKRASVPSGGTGSGVT